MDICCVGSAGTKHVTAPTEMGPPHAVLSDRQGASKPGGDHTRAANMLHFKHQYKLPAWGIKI